MKVILKILPPKYTQQFLKDPITSVPAGGEWSVSCPRPFTPWERKFGTFA
jgi:hypothetical protein